MDYSESINNSKKNRTTSSSSSSSNSNSQQPLDVPPLSVASSSQQSNNSNGGATYNLEYCTSSSSISPFESYSKNSLLRKRRISSTGLTQDPELSLEPPSAKRLQRVSSTHYQSDSSSSLVSSAYPASHKTDKDDRYKTLSSSGSSDFLLAGQPNLDESPQLVINSSDSSVTYEDNLDQFTIATNQNFANFVQQFTTHEAPTTYEAPVLSNCAEVGDDDDLGDNDDDEVILASRNSSPAVIEYTSGSTFRSTRFNDAHCARNKRTPATATANKCNSSVSAVKSFDDYVSALECMTPVAEPDSSIRQCPLPALSWANAADVWQLMCKKDEQASCLRNAAMLESHPGLGPRMRAILLDWLIEVCEVYKLHRETYYLAVDFLDRYLSTQKEVQKTHLQLIGITCLFIAAKVEEIYPPKINEFAYVTDGACQEAEILQHEILLLQALKWNTSPVTPMGWLGVYMQLNVNNRTPASFNNASAANANVQVDDAFIYPQFSGMEFVQTAQLLDLCSLDVGMGDFSYSVIAAAAMSHTFNRETALRCSGLDWETIETCVRWMEPFFQIVCEESHHLHLMEQNDQIVSKHGLGHICPNIVTDDSHIIQTHTTTMAMFDRACLLQEQYHLSTLASKLKQETSPAIGLICPEGLLTPPASSRKQNGVDGGSNVGAEAVDPNVEAHKNVAVTATATATATAAATTTAAAVAYASQSAH